MTVNLSPVADTVAATAPTGYRPDMALTRLFVRPLLGAFFVVNGIDSLRNAEALAREAKPVTDRFVPLMEKAAPDGTPVPTEAVTWVRINGAVQIAAAAALMTGKFPRIASGVLAASLVPSTAARYRFWEASDPAERREQLTHFFKNVSLTGGLLIAAGDTEGKPGLAWRARTGRSRRPPRGPAPRSHAKREAKLVKAELTWLAVPRRADYQPAEESLLEPRPVAAPGATARQCGNALAHPQFDAPRHPVVGPRRCPQAATQPARQPGGGGRHVGRGADQLSDRASPARSAPGGCRAAGARGPCHVLMQIAAEGDVEDLQAAAHAEHRHAELDRRAEQRDLGLVAEPVDVAWSTGPRRAPYDAGSRSPPPASRRASTAASASSGGSTLRRDHRQRRPVRRPAAASRSGYGSLIPCTGRIPHGRGTWCRPETMPTTGRRGPHAATSTGLEESRRQPAEPFVVRRQVAARQVGGRCPGDPDQAGGQPVDDRVA